MKRFFAFVILFINILVLSGCSKKAEHPYFNGTVLEIYKNSVLVKPFEGSEELKSADQITVSCDVISAQEVPKMEVGTSIRIEYDGSIAESYPAQINHVFAIYLVDADGEIVEGRSGAGTKEENFRW